jgi:pSer/pThr/pTyr-binding forkhead associated (FHA) protein
VKYCAFCGRENDAGARFCIDCGKPLNASSARVTKAYTPGPSGMSAPNIPTGLRAETTTAPLGMPLAAQRQPTPLRVPQQPQPEGSVNCPSCGHPSKGLAFCGFCGTHLTAAPEPGICGHCGSTFARGIDLFCASCGKRVGSRVSIESTSVLTPPGMGRDGFPKLSLLGEEGEPVRVYTLERGEAVVGRGDADIRFEDDHYMSPQHTRLEVRDGQLLVRDLGSRNGTWLFIDEPMKLAQGDLVLVGAQLLRFRRLGYPGPHLPEADSTRRMGSAVPAIDLAVMEQLRADGSVRDTFHLSSGRVVLLGREAGDWIFPYDSTMSARHAEIHSVESDFFVHDVQSRNGVATAVRGERFVHRGQSMLIGDQLLRVESV